MTVFIADIASYQGALKLTDVRRAGYEAVNFKVSHGLTVKAVHPRIRELVIEARALGLHRASFHYLTGEATGRAQADHAYGQLLAAGLAWGAPHFADCEADATQQILTDYVARMSVLLGRPVGIYSGDWWWQVRGWPGSALSPHLMAAPNGGYLAAYPGDNSPAWIAGWGGWAQISVLQYEVGVLRYPDGTSGTIRVSKAAVRDLTVWAELAGGQMTSPVCTTEDLEVYAGPVVPDPWTDVRGWPTLLPGERSSTEWMADLLPDGARSDAAARAAWILVAALVHMRAELNQVFPNRDKSSDGSVGDLAHQTGTSGHNPDEEGHSETTDADSINEVRAIDIDVDLRGGASMEEVVQYLVLECRAGRITWIRYIIFNKRIWSDSSEWVTRAYNGSNPHDKHAHVSCHPDTASENNTKSLGLANLLEGDDMNATEMTAWASSSAGRAALARALLQFDPGLGADGKVVPGGIPNPDPAGAPSNPTLSPAHAFYCAIVASQRAYTNTQKIDAMAGAVGALASAVAAVAKKVTDDDAELGQITSAISSAQAALVASQKQAVADTLSGLTAAGRSDQDIAAALRATLGDRADEVGRLLAGVA